jgi:hypothetical protein
LIPGNRQRLSTATPIAIPIPIPRPLQATRIINLPAMPEVL